MTLEEEGAYRRLIDYCWLNGCIPADPQLVARLIGKGATVAIAEAVLPMFEPNPDQPGTLIHDRLEVERKRQEINRTKNQNAANARWGRVDDPPVEQVQEEENADAMQTHSTRKVEVVQVQCSSSSSSSSSATALTTPKSSRNQHMSSDCSTGVGEVFEYWREKTGHSQALLTAKRKTRIRDRLKEGYDVAQLKRAIDGNLASPHHRGENDKGIIWDDLELICRSGEKVEFFLNIANGNGVRGSPQGLDRFAQTRNTANNAKIIESWSQKGAEK